MIYVSGIPSRFIDDVWQDCRKYVEMGINKAQEEMNSHDIYFFLKDAEMQLWIVFEDQEKKIMNRIRSDIERSKEGGE